MYGFGLTMVFILIMGPIMFGIYSPNVNQAGTLSLAAGEAMVACHEAAIAYAVKHPNVGNTGTTPTVITGSISGIKVGCDNTSTALSTLNMEVLPSSALVSSMTGRVVTTWLPSAAYGLGNSTFNDTVRQVEQIRIDDPSIGIVYASGSTQCNASGASAYSVCAAVASNCIAPYINTAAATSTGTGSAAAPIKYTRLYCPVAIPSGPAAGDFVMQTVINP